MRKEESKTNKFWKEFTKGLIISNPVFALTIGMCPSLAVSNSLDNAIWMSIGVIFVLLCSNVIIASIRKMVPDIVRIPVFIVVIATFVTIISLVFQAYVPALYDTLGIYLPLIVVNCIIMARAEAYASKNPVILSIADALGAGAGFMIALIIISFIRQILGTGELSAFGTTFFTLPVLGEHPMIFFVLPPGAFLVISMLLVLFRKVGVLKK